MTGRDLIPLVPWLVFGAGLAVVLLRLRRARRSGSSSDLHRASIPPAAGSGEIEVPGSRDGGGSMEDRATRRAGRCGRGGRP
jgi:hypothetical protein